MSKLLNILKRVRHKISAAIALAPLVASFVLGVSLIPSGLSAGDVLGLLFVGLITSLIFAFPYIMLNIGEDILYPVSEMEKKANEKRRRKNFPKISNHNFTYYLQAEKLVKEINSFSAEGVTVLTALSFAEDTLVYLQTSLEELSSGTYDPDSRVVKEKLTEVRNSISSLMDVRDQMSELKLTSGYRPGPPSKNEVFKEINLLKSSFKETDSGLLN